MNQISVELEKSHDLRNVVFDIHGWAGGSGPLNRVRQFALMVWNPTSIRTVRNAIADFKPDVILLHNIMPVGSAALYYQLSRCGIPVVHYIHNFRPFSVNGYCWGSGRILTEGLELNFVPEILAGSWQESHLKTAWYGLLIRALHALGVYRRISGWIAISRFMKDAFVKGGIEESRIRVIPHSWEPTQTRPFSWVASPRRKACGCCWTHGKPMSAAGAGACSTLRVRARWRMRCGNAAERWRGRIIWDSAVERKRTRCLGRARRSSSPRCGGSRSGWCFTRHTTTPSLCWQRHQAASSITSPMA